MFDLFEEYTLSSAGKDETECDMYLSGNVKIDRDDLDVLKMVEVEWFSISGFSKNGP